MPLERQMTWTVLFSSGFVSASSVGEKNIASSSGCAISSVIRWFRSSVIRAEERVYSLCPCLVAACFSWFCDAGSIYQIAARARGIESAANQFIAEDE